MSEPFFRNIRAEGIYINNFLTCRQSASLILKRVVLPTVAGANVLDMRLKLELQLCICFGKYRVVGFPGAPRYLYPLLLIKPNGTGGKQKNRYKQDTSHIFLTYLVERRRE